MTVVSFSVGVMEISVTVIMNCEVVSKFLLLYFLCVVGLHMRMIGTCPSLS